MGTLDEGQREDASAWTAITGKGIADELTALRADNDRLRAEREALTRLAAALQEAVSTEALLAVAARVVAAELDVPRVALFLYDDDGTHVLDYHLHGYPRTAITATALARAPREIALERRMLAAKRPIAVERIEDGDTRLNVTWQGPFVVAPLLRDGQVLGCLYLGRQPSRHALSLHDGTLLEGVAGQLAAALDRARLFAEEQRRRAEAEALAAVAHAASSLAVPEVLDAALTMATRAIPCDLALVTLVDPDGQTLRVVAARGEHAARYQTIAVPVDQGYNGYVYRTRQPLLIHDAQQDPRRYSVAGYTDSLNTILCAPLIARDRALGTLYLARAAAGSFPQADLRLLTTLAGQVALAIDNARLFEAEQRRRADAEALATVAASLGVRLSSRKVLQVVAEQAQRALGAKRACVWRIERGTRTLTLQASAGLDPAIRRQAANLPVRPGEAPALDHLLAGGAAVAVNDVTSGTRPPSDMARRFQIRSFLAAPIPGGDGPLGLLYVDQHDQCRHWTPDDLRLAEALAGQAGAALVNADLYTTERQRAAREATLREVGHELSAELTLQGLLATLQRHLRQLTGLDNCWVSLWDESSDIVHTCLWIEQGQRIEEWERVGPRQPNLTSVLLTERQPILVDDYLEECRRRGVTPMGHRAEEPHCAWFGLPLVAGGRVIGAMAAWRWGRPIAPETVSVLETLSGQIATALENARLYEEAARRHAEEVAFNAIARDLAASLDSGTVLQRITEHARQLLAAEYAEILLHDPASDLLLTAAVSGMGEGPFRAAPVQPGEGVSGKVWHDGQPLRVEDYLNDQRFEHSPPLTRLAGEIGLTSVLGVPIVLGDARLGVLIGGSATRRRFTAHDEALLLRLATQAALSVRNARLYARAEERATRLEILNEIGHELSKELDFDRFLETAWRQLARFVGAENCWLALVDEATGELEYYLYVADGVRHAEWEQRRPGAGLGAALAQERRPIRVDDYVTECQRRGLMPSGPAVGRRDMAWLGTPLITGGRVVGALAVWRWSGPFSDEELATLETLGGQMAAALENARLYREARLLAATDPLTGLFNHGAVLERLAEELARADRHQHTLAVAMLDLDNFKLFNDSYGHPVGDQMLRLVAGVLRAEARANDVLGRYGGDEFMLVLPETTGDGALALVERVRTRLRTLHEELGQPNAAPLSTSAGIALYPDDATAWQTLVTLADAALYVSKRGGGRPVTARENGARGLADLPARNGCDVLGTLARATEQDASA